jgi:hypothetical protein
MPVKNVKVTMAFVKKQITDKVQAGILATVYQLKDELVLATPVDTGLARESWEVYPIKVGVHPAYEIRNNTPYIGALNDGHSDQAPAHFIESIALKYGRAKGQVVTYKDE